MSGQGQIKENIDPAFVINDGTDSGYILVKHILVNSTSEEVTCYHGIIQMRLYRTRGHVEHLNIN